MLAGALRKKGLNATSAGNIMLDTVPMGDYDIPSRRTHPTLVTLLPGSRVWTGDSLKLYTEALRQVPQALTPDLFVAVAGGLSPADLAAASGLALVPPASNEPTDLGVLNGDGIQLHLVRGAVGNLIAASDVVLSQAGTATQQALGLGKPVITFNRADNRKKRMRDEQALMGEARILTPPDAGAVATALTGLLGNPDERARLGAIGKARLGGPGTLAAVVADLRP